MTLYSTALQFTISGLKIALQFTINGLHRFKPRNACMDRKIRYSPMVIFLTQQGILDRCID